MSAADSGQIITFYSYKGGTGRTMALANVACLLAQRQVERSGKGVLIVDWDLEAPGLHRFFRNSPASGDVGSFSKAEHRSTPGLIDLAYRLEEGLQERPAQNSDDPEVREFPRSEAAARALIEQIGWRKYVVPAGLPGLDLMTAGRFDAEDPVQYAERVNKFDWESLYNRSPHLLRVLAETWAREYAYVLIDSRTGVTDTSGICTTLLPEKLVVVFTPNRQSLMGGLELVRRATAYRKESSDLRPLLVFPLVSRVEATEPELRHDWRFGSEKYGTAGYQREFERALAQVYGKSHVELTSYFDELQVQHIPRFAYGEEIAVLVEKSGDRFSLRRSYETFANKLVEARAAWSEADASQSEVKRSVSQRSRWFFAGLRALVQNKWAQATLVAGLFMSVLLLAQLEQVARANTETANAALKAANAELLKESQRRVLLEQRLAEVAEPLKTIDRQKEENDALFKKYEALRTESNLAREAALKDREAAKRELLAKQELQANVVRLQKSEKDLSNLLHQNQERLKACKVNCGGQKGPP